MVGLHSVKSCKNIKRMFKVSHVGSIWNKHLASYSFEVRSFHLNRWSSNQEVPYNYGIPLLALCANPVSACASLAHPFFYDFMGQFCKPQIDANIPQLLVVSSVLNYGSACILTPWICPCFNVVKCFKHIANWNIAWSSMPSYQLLFF